MSHAPIAATDPRPVPSSSLRLLVVERTMPETLRALLHLLTRDGRQGRHGRGTVAAGSAAAAADDFDFVISDLGLPLTGPATTFMRALRDRQACAASP